MTGNLFASLLSLHNSPVPEEDFFTEIVAWLLDTNQYLLISWLSIILNFEETYISYKVETQVSFSKLEGHLTGSRPDILISLFGEENTDFVIIESKLSSYEGYEQLPRYAEQLAENFPVARNRYLVYITREYDRKEATIVTKKIKNNVIFRQVRWHEFYDFLKKQQPSTLLEEILEFMRRKNMSQITRITPATLAAFNSFPDVFEFFQTVLNGDVTDQFIKIIGQKPRSGLDQFQYRRHILYTTSTDWEYHLGFRMPLSNEEFPTAGVRLYVKPYLPIQRYIELTSLLTQIVKDTKENNLSWEGNIPDKLKTWAYIELACPFSEILQEEDHVAALKKYLLMCLNETKRIVEQYSIIIKLVNPESNLESNQILP